MIEFDEEALAQAFSQMGLGEDKQEGGVIDRLEKGLNQIIVDYKGRPMAEVREALLALQRDTRVKLNGIDRMSREISRGEVIGSTES